MEAKAGSERQRQDYASEPEHNGVDDDGHKSEPKTRVHESGRSGHSGVAYRRGDRSAHWPRDANASDWRAARVTKRRAFSYVRTAFRTKHVAPFSFDHRKSTKRVCRSLERSYKRSYEHR